jgi:hypothetical protein
MSKRFRDAYRTNPYTLAAHVCDLKLGDRSIRIANVPLALELHYESWRDVAEAFRDFAPEDGEERLVFGIYGPDGQSPWDPEDDTARDWRLTDPEETPEGEICDPERPAPSDQEGNDAEGAAKGGWFRRRDPFGWYVPAHNRSDDYGIHLDPGRIRRLAQKLATLAEDPMVDPDDWLVAAISLVFWHEQGHALVEEWVTLWELPFDHEKYARTMRRRHGFIPMEEALCNTYAHGVATVFWQSHRQGPTILRALGQFMRSQPRGYRDFVPLKTWPTLTWSFFYDMARLLVREYGVEVRRDMLLSQTDWLSLHDQVIRRGLRPVLSAPCLVPLFLHDAQPQLANSNGNGLMRWEHCRGVGLEQFLPLHVACRSGDLEDLVLLLRDGASVDSPAATMPSPRDQSVAARLWRSLWWRWLEDWSRPDRRHSLWYGAPLTTAVLNNHLVAVKLLLERSANPNHQASDPFHRSPLHWAVDRGHDDLVKLLLQHGADPTLKDLDGQTPRDLARGEGMKALLEMKTP